MWTEEDKSKFKVKQQPTLDKFISKMKSKGITMTPDLVLDNMIITDGDNTIKMCNHSIYRYSGMSHIMKGRKGKGDEMDYVPLSYQMWLDMFISVAIENRLNKKTY